MQVTDERGARNEKTHSEFLIKWYVISAWLGALNDMATKAEQ